MNLFELFIKVGVDDQASRQVSSLSSKLGNGLKTAAKIGTMAVSAAGTAIAVMTKQSLDSFAEYEQLTGGIETLFKDSSGKLKKYADDAFESAGLSSNKYMALVTSFSASLIKSLEGDTESAVDLADQTVIDMSDNANKLGTDLSMIQNAYQGFSRGQFQLLDNLKLGYGGTKTEMQRLIREAALLDDSIDANSLSFANIAKAIHVVQNEMGITGTTLAEGATTIEGSGKMAAAAWENLKVAMATDDEALIERRVDEFVDKAETYAENVLPRIKKILTGGSRLIMELSPEIVKLLPELTAGLLPELINSSDDLLAALIDALPATLQSVSPELRELTKSLLTTAFTAGPDLIDDLVVVLADSLEQIVIGAFEAIVENFDKIFLEGLKFSFSPALKIYDLWKKSVAPEGENTFTDEELAELEKGNHSVLYKKLNENEKKSVVYAKDDSEIDEEKLKELIRNMTDGSHASGLSYVPFDGYIAELHEGERILTKQQAQGYRGSGITINITVNGAQYDDGDALAETVALRLQRVLEDEEVAYE